MLERVALKGTPFPDGSGQKAGMHAELQKMKPWQPEAQKTDPAQVTPQPAAEDEPQIVSAQEVAHMQPWSPADLEKARRAAGSGTLPAPTPHEDQPKVLSEADLPQKTPWSTRAAQQADQLAQQAELAAAQAEIDAQKKQSLFEQEDTAQDKVDADHAARQAKELELRAKVAEEIAEEQAQWATEQGELRTANHILAADPTLWQVDENTTLPKT